MPVKGHTHDQEAMERTAESWCDDATASRVLKLADQMRDELSGVHSDYRRKNMLAMVLRRIGDATPQCP